MSENIWTKCPSAWSIYFGRRWHFLDILTQYEYLIGYLTCFFVSSVDLARSYGRQFDPKAPLDDWGQKEKEQFLKHRDKNGDKRMDREEVGEWIMPTDYDPVEAEAKHLIYHADDDKVRVPLNFVY